MTRPISLSRPTTGSSLPSRAMAVRSRANSSRSGVRPSPRPCRRPGLRDRPSAARGRAVLALLGLGLAEEAHGGAQLLVVDADPRQVGLEGRALLASGGDDEMLGADIVRARHVGFLGRPLEEGARAPREGQVADDRAGAALLDRALELVAELEGIDLEAAQGLEADALPLLDDGEEDMLGQDLIGPGPLGLFLGENGEHALGAMGQVP